MRSLKICPKCHAKLKLDSDSETQYCTVCKYWTKIGTGVMPALLKPDAK